MLVLTRKDGQRILFSNGIVITVCQTKSGSVRLGIEAPRDVVILRDELAPQMDDDAIARDELVAGKKKVKEQRPVKG